MTPTGDFQFLKSKVDCLARLEFGLMGLCRSVMQFFGKDNTKGGHGIEEGGAYFLAWEGEVYDEGLSVTLLLMPTIS
jgi:hypothetical protein